MSSLDGLFLTVNGDRARDLRRELTRVAIDYPAGQATLVRLLAGAVGPVPPETLVVANGTSELIRILCGSVTEGTIVPVPTFNEYETALPADSSD